MYGLPNLIKSRTFHQKLIWLTFLLISTAISSWFIYASIISYFEFNVVTIIKSIYQQPTEFPTISFCSYSTRYFDNKTLKEIIRDCNFANDNRCKIFPENFFQVFYTNLGKCYRFNSGKNFTNQTIEILNSTISGIDDSFDLSIEKSVDLAVWIHDRKLAPTLSDYNNHHSNKLFITSASYTQITLEKIIESQLGEPYNQCISNSTEFSKNKTIINFILLQNFSYTQTKCLELCFDLDYIENSKCDCNGSRLGNVWDYCWIKLENSTKESCTWNFKNTFYMSNIIDKCSIFCPLECETVSYNFQNSVLGNYNKTRMRIFYKSLRHTTITQEPKMNIYDLVSNIGGTFGLFIGVSFVTFIELAEVLVQTVVFIFLKKF